MSTSTKAWVGPRADAVPTNTLPVLIWNDPRTIWPTRCEHCGAKSLVKNAPTHSQPGDVTCWTCSRQTAWIREGPTLTRLPDSQPVPVAHDSWGPTAPCCARCGRDDIKRYAFRYCRQCYRKTFEGGRR